MSPVAWAACKIGIVLGVGAGLLFGDRLHADIADIDGRRPVARARSSESPAWRS